VEEVLLKRVKNGTFQSKSGTFNTKDKENGSYQIQAKKKGKVLMDKARIFQLIEIVRRIKTEEMVRFKFLMNFGVEKETVERLKRMTLDEEEEARKNVEQMGEEELWVIRLYLELCADLLDGVKIHKGLRTN
jgi:hypothetical protein